MKIIPIAIRMVNEIKNRFRSLYNKEAEILVKAPGRINLIGEHTDYNAGLVLPAAIDKCMYFLFSSNDSNLGRVYAKDLNKQATIDLNNLQKTDSVWVNYIVGLLLEFKIKGLSLKGFECVFFSDIPIGAGMSSSAALECGFAMGMNHINQLNLGSWEIVDMSHHSNHTFMNIYGGIMDQFTSLFGQNDKCMLMNCADRSFSYHDIDLKEYSIVMLNTNVKHEHTISGYNERSAECKEIVKRLQKFDSDIKSISETNNETIYTAGIEWPDNLKRRARFVINENDRVLEFSRAMKNGDIQKLGELLYQSHYGLQHLFEVSCPELNFLVDLTRDNQDILGARMMGGGFGGCTINLMKSDCVEEITKTLISKYKERVGIQAESYFVKVSDGAHVMML